jgi:hypothetical protein
MRAFMEFGVSEHYERPRAIGIRAGKFSGLSVHI